MELKNNLIIYPTDTVWGIGCNIFDKELVQKIHEIKGSDKKKPMSIAFGSIESLKKSLSKDIGSYIELFDFKVSLGIPLVFFNEVIPSWVHCGSDFVVCRVLGLEFLQGLDFPIITTSLNRTGEEAIHSEVKAREFAEEIDLPKQCFVREDFKVDGKPSTILVLNEAFELRVIRKGEDLGKIRSRFKLLPA